MAVSTVSHHPVLPRPFYRMCEASPQVGPEHLNVAYFGEFYSSRGLIEVTSAMRTLPDGLRERVRLHVFTNYVPATEGGKLRPSSKTEAFRKATKVPVHLPLSGKTMAFDAAGNCTSGC